jgi:hypothetical protein
VIVAVIPVLVVQVGLHHVVDVIPVRHRDMPALRPVDMRLVVLATGMLGRTPRRVGAADRERVLVDVVTVDVVQVPVMKVIDVALVPYSRVAAAGAVLVSMILMRGMIVHDSPFPTGETPIVWQSRADARPRSNSSERPEPRLEARGNHLVERHPAPVKAPARIATAWN